MLSTAMRSMISDQMPGLNAVNIQADALFQSVVRAARVGADTTNRDGLKPTTEPLNVQAMKLLYNLLQVETAPRAGGVAADCTDGNRYLLRIFLLVAGCHDDGDYASCLVATHHGIIL